MNKEEITKEDILNVTGSMFDTMFDYVDNSNKELEQLQQENKHLQEKLDQALKDYDKVMQNWENLKEYIKENIIYGFDDYYDMKACGFEESYNKMEELEKDSNE